MTSDVSIVLSESENSRPVSDLREVVGVLGTGLLFDGVGMLPSWSGDLSSRCEDEDNDLDCMYVKEEDMGFAEVDDARHVSPPFIFGTVR